MAPTVPLLPCRPQHSSIPEDARRRSLSVIVGKTPLGSTLPGWGQLSGGCRGSGAGSRDFQGIAWAKHWREGGSGAQCGLREPGSLVKLVLCSRDMCLCRTAAGGMVVMIT